MISFSAIFVKIAQVAPTCSAFIGSFSVSFPPAADLLDERTHQTKLAAIYLYRLCWAWFLPSISFFGMKVSCIMDRGLQPWSVTFRSFFLAAVAVLFSRRKCVSAFLPLCRYRLAKLQGFPSQHGLVGGLCGVNVEEKSALCGSMV